MIALTLEDVVEALTECDVKPKRRKHWFGLYDPSCDTIWYNPSMIASKEEFVLTILHEIAHHTYPEETNEGVIENIALSSYDDMVLSGYVMAYFEREIRRYWKE